jgi:hypothetical protein
MNHIFGKGAMAPWGSRGPFMGQLKYFDVPLGAFPVPWGPDDETEEGRQRRGMGRQQMGVIPSVFGYPFSDKEDDVPREYYGVHLPPAPPIPPQLKGSYEPRDPEEEEGDYVYLPEDWRSHDEAEIPPGAMVWMGQAPPSGVTCEDTPEGGKRCSDGTYHPPGCPMTPGTGIPAQAPSGAGGGFPVGWVAAGAAAAAAGAYFLLAGHRHLGAEPGEPAAFETAYPEAAAEIHKIADRINVERSNDAYWFAKYIDASKRRQDFVFTVGAAEKELAKQQQIWDATHRNSDQLQAAQATLDAVTSQQGAAAAERDEAKAGIDSAAANVLVYRQNADVTIASLPAEYQAPARRIIDPCFVGPALKGIPTRPLMGQYSWNQFTQPQGTPYSWNQMVQPAGGPDSWNRVAQPAGGPGSWNRVARPLGEPPAAAGGSDVHCYQCHSPEAYVYLSESQAKQWNDQYGRNCGRVADQNCGKSQPQARTPSSSNLFNQALRLAPGPAGFTSFAMTGPIPTRPLMGQVSLGAPSRFEGVELSEYHRRTESAGIPTRRGIFR